MKVLRRALRVALLDRSATRDSMWDESATADAVLLVAGVAVTAAVVRILLTGGFDLLGLLETAVWAVARWLLVSLAIWLAATRLFRSSGSAQTMMRAAGFAVLPLLAEVVPVISLLGYAWFLAALVVATGEAMDLDLKGAVGSVLVGAAVVLLVQLIFRVPFILF